ncbi:MAG TPA: ATP-binding cassette domain-containing protein, partial [Mycobacteriales bacterium]|nr:ATP-binding cassette domain-containing protein [Mycobacteriales bacterium]
LADTDREAWWRRIAWVPQRPALVAGTVADNITLGNAADDDSVLAVLNAAGGAELDPERVLGEGGSGLSAGQKQRVAVARALLRCTGGADLLLLDEPTEHLDRDNEATVLRAITALAHDPVTPRCVLMATHRPEAIAVADRVVRLDANPRDERADDHAASVG